MDVTGSLSPFQEVSEKDAIQIAVPLDLPASTFTLADYVDKSETLTKLVQLGKIFAKVNNSFGVQER